MRVALLLLLVACNSGSGGGGTGGGGAGDPTVINGIMVPAVPDPALNAATVAGIDSNTNGVRDDVERFLATEYGTDAALHAEATLHAKALQRVLVEPTPANVEAHLRQVDCLDDEVKLAKLSKLARATADTGERRTAYGLAFAGASLSGKGCTP
ncbi:MAG: hypothetical protein JNK82_25400 [Myxococcaceae bacterium]|nr:hypothetical protein [Myxococcaceae bacterium]